VSEEKMPGGNGEGRREHRSLKTISLEKLFGPKGPLARHLKSYEFRAEQLEVATAIEQAMEEGKVCLVEAGTGVGKTLAYLIPAVREALKGRTTVISTHTIGLQTQLIRKDIPLALSLFPEAKGRVRATLMKGRGNYLCKLELENAKHNLFLLGDPLFKEVERWQSRPGCSGDVSDLPFHFSAWNEIASNVDTCRGQECRFYEECFYYRMRHEAAESEIIVVNHALFLSDLALRYTEPEAGILPDYHHVVLDEAHHLEDVATKTFGIEYSARRLPNLLERIGYRSDLDIDRTRLQALEQMNADLFNLFAQSKRSECLLEEGLDEQKLHQAGELAALLMNSLRALEGELLDIARQDESLRDVAEGLGHLCGRAREELQLLFSEQQENHIRWVEAYGDTARTAKAREAQGNTALPRVVLHRTPVSIAEVLDKALWQSERLLRRTGSVTLISATLATSGSFEFLRKRLGIPEDAIERIVGSPFQYREQALLYVPAHLPEPAAQPSPCYVEQVVEEIVKILNLTEGRAFLLFTSRAMLDAVKERLRLLVPYPLFVQGEMPAGMLLEAFRNSQNGCLLGLQTFWEGVDIPGEALSCVIIDRLPFAVPDSPIMRARQKEIIEQEGDWFRDLAMPIAQIKLKQGFGRLIRSHSDRGIVCILDTRLIKRGYGADFVRHLPPASRASKWFRVERFWKEGRV
jgi:ATP-dependent DNA helicase DinG